MHVTGKLKVLRVHISQRTAVLFTYSVISIDFPCTVSDEHTDIVKYIQSVAMSLGTRGNMLNIACQEIFATLCIYVIGYGVHGVILQGLLKFMLLDLFYEMFRRRNILTYIQYINVVCLNVNWIGYKVMLAFLCDIFVCGSTERLKYDEKR